ncbi:unnamed protein product [Linum tenue]|uniref:Secreted protein n=1 Tax=Linum tenue TaxID=586396 RepID=A0AAV0H7K6_9ROSI|nr:unnamed protein product [Linum tenue]
MLSLSISGYRTNKETFLYCIFPLLFCSILLLPSHAFVSRFASLCSFFCLPSREEISFLHLVLSGNVEGKRRQRRQRGWRQPRPTTISKTT